MSLIMEFEEYFAGQPGEFEEPEDPIKHCGLELEFLSVILCAH